MLLEWVGVWSIYMHDCGREPVQSFDTEEAAQDWLDEQAKIWGDEAFYKNLRIVPYEEPEVSVR